MKFKSLNLTQKIAYNAGFSALSRIVEMALSVFIIAILTRYLGSGRFGDYITAVAFIQIFSVIADLGLYSIVVREISREGADEEKIVNNAFTFRIVAGLFILSSAFFVSLVFPYSADVKYGIAVAAAGFWILSNIQVLMGLFQKHLAMDRVALAEIAGKITQIVFIVLFIYFDLGFLYIILTIFLGSLVNFLLIIKFSSKYVKIKLRFDLKFWRKLLKKSFPIAISAILVLIYFRMDTIFLSILKSSEDVGVYGLSYKIMESLVFFPAMIVGLTMPIISRNIFSDKEKFKSIVQRTLNFLIITVVPLVVGVVMISKKIIDTISGEGFYDSPAVLNMLMIALGFIFFGALFSNIIIAADMQKRLAQIYLFGAIFNIVANLIFIPKYSYFGAAGTTVLTEFFVTVLMVWVVYKAEKFVPSFKVFFKALLASFLMAAAINFLDYLNILCVIFIGFFVYAVAIYFIGGISKEEIRKLMDRNGRELSESL